MKDIPTYTLSNLSIHFDKTIEYNHSYVAVRKNYYWGLIDKDGVLILPCVYDWIWDIVGDFVQVRYNGYIYSIPLSLLPSQYDVICGFHHELSIVKLNNKYGVIDKLGIEIFPCIYENLIYCKDRLFREKLKKDSSLYKKYGWKYIIIDKWKLKIDTKEYFQVVPLSNGFKKVLSHKCKWGVIDTYNRKLIPCLYDSIEYKEESQSALTHNIRQCNFDNNGYFEAKLDNEFRVISIDNITYYCGTECPQKSNKNESNYCDIKKVINAPNQRKYSRNNLSDETLNGYEQIIIINKFKLVVDSNGRWGILSNNNKEIVSCIYDEIIEVKKTYYHNLKPYCFNLRKSDAWNFLWIGEDRISINASSHTLKEKIEIIEIDNPVLELKDISSIKENKKSREYQQVIENGFYGITDNCGKKIVECNYRQIDNFKYGVAPAKDREGKWGGLDFNGREIIPFIYDYVHPFEPDKTACVILNGKFGRVNIDGELILPCIYSKIGSNSNNPIYKDFIMAYKDNETPKNKNATFDFWSTHKKVFLDKQWKEVIPYSELNRHITSIEYVPVDINKEKQYVKIQKDYKFGIFDFKDNIILSCSYKNIYSLGDLFVVQNSDEYWGVYNSNGQVVIPCVFSKIESHERIGDVNFFTVKDIHNHWGVYNLNGETVVPLIFDYIRHIVDENYTIVVKEDKCGIYENFECLLVPCIYDIINDVSEGLSAVAIKNNSISFQKHKYKWGFINLRNEVVIPIKYEEAHSYSHGLAAVRISEKWGFINTENKTIIPFIYDNVESGIFNRFGRFVDGLICVGIKNKNYIIDVQGKVIVDLMYYGIGTFTFDDGIFFKNGIERICNENGEGYISRTGRVIDWEKEESQYYETPDYAADTWDALTDGQYGDYPGEGYDIRDLY